MSDIAIRVEKLGKRYRIGERQPYLALRDVLTNAAKAPLRVFKRSAPEASNNGTRHIWAVKDVSFEVREGEVVGIIGRNGAGKSTLLKILARVAKPTEGFAKVHGRLGSLLEVGTGFHWELTGRENVYLSGAILGMRKREIARKFDEIVAFAEVEKFIDTPLKHYSTGMEMRLAFAVAAHLEPEILLVDEVLAVGDAAFQKKCLGKMGEVAGEGRTILLVSHNISAVRGISNRCLLIEAGRIRANGEVSAVVERYLGQGNGELPNRVDTTNWGRPDGLGTDAKVTEVHLDTPGRIARLLTWAPLAVEMELDVCRPVEDVVYGFAVYSSEGIRLFQCHNTDMGRPYHHLLQGKYRIRCTVEKLILPPGRYRLDIGVRCGSKGLDWLRDVMLFEVEESEVPECLWFKAQDGLFRQPSRWDSPELIPRSDMGRRDGLSDDLIVGREL